MRQALKDVRIPTKEDAEEGGSYKVRQGGEHMDRKNKGKMAEMEKSANLTAVHRDIGE